MEYGCRPRYQSPIPLVFPNYYAHERPAPLSLPQVPRANQRPYPVGGPAGIQMRTGSMREEEIQESHGNARRRIAIACARCRKRKIRCSGDPGDGSGCVNCKQAGIDVSLCAFHRVGSTDAQAAWNAVILSNNQNNAVQNYAQANVSVPIYSTNGNAVYNHRAWPGPQYTAQIDTKSAIYAQNWAVSYSEETSPVETFGLEQSTPCIPNNNALPSVHSQAYRWPQSTQRSFSEQENISQYVTKAEAMSPLNMASVSSALPVAAPVPGPQVSDHAIIAPRSDPSIIAPRLKLPMPHPSPAQSTRNMVDLLQDQRLRSSQMAPPTSLNANFAKPLSNWASDIPGTEVRSTSALMSSSTESAATSSSFTSVTNDASMAYVPLTAASNEINGAVTTTPPQLSFNTTPLLEAMPNPLSSTTYSNFRDYAQPISSSGDALSMFAPHSSRYSFSTENTKNLNEGALISGQPYTPLKTPADAQQTAKRENKQRQLTVVPSPN